MLKKPNLELIFRRASGTLELAALVQSSYQLVGWAGDMNLPDFAPLLFIRISYTKKAFVLGNPCRPKGQEGELGSWSHVTSGASQP